MDNFNEAEVRNVGVTKGLKSPMKMAIFFVRDILVLLGTFGFCVLTANIFPPNQHVRLIVYYIWNMIFSIWLILPVWGNPGKRNYNMIWDSLFLIGKPKKLRSFDYHEFDSITELARIGGAFNVNKFNGKS